MHTINRKLVEQSKNFKIAIKNTDKIRRIQNVYNRVNPSHVLLATTDTKLYDSYCSEYGKLLQRQKFFESVSDCWR